jgi:UDP-N-acetylmuramate--alanine ligase
VAVELGVYVEEALQSLACFEGVKRRSELVAEIGGIRIFDDYGHHPTEISATLRALRSGWIDSDLAVPGAQLKVIFQPHRYSRTRELFAEFLNAFGSADEVVVGEIYPAGESPIDGVSGERLARAIDHKCVSFVNDLDKCISDLRERLKPGDVVVTLGAGNVGSVGYRLAELIKGSQ